ncbi:MAG: PAAR domain-containing protein [Deltaproteobacteria bacterium]|nr:PAAR domain-containing protein [Deltaproteobacteria bacterium]
MPPAARIADMHTCPMVNPGPVPHVGGPVSSGSPDVIIGFMPAGRVGDTAVCVPAVDSISKGSATVLINQRMAARIGDPTAHGGVIVVGCPSVLIGDSGQGCTLRLAAKSGAPFCEECERAKKQQEKELLSPPPPNQPPPDAALLGPTAGPPPAGDGAPLDGAKAAGDAAYQTAMQEIMACKDISGHPKHKALEKADTGGKPVLVIMAGPPAAGKSTFRKSDAALAKLDAVDADAIKQEIHEGKISPPPMGTDGKPLAGRWKLKPANAAEEKINTEIHEASSEISKQRIASALESGRSILYDTVGGSPEKVKKLVAEAAAKGFHVHMALAYTDVGTSLEANRKRERTVPAEIVTEGHKKVTTHWPSYKDLPGVATVDKRVRQPSPPAPPQGA